MFKQKTALIGTGYWGSKLRNYIPKYFKLVYEANSKSDLDIIWRDNTIKSVIIATPIETHYELCKYALNSGKHVFCEKPITLHYHEAQELITLAENKNLKICVDYVQTFSPAIIKIKKLLLDLSPIEYIEMSTKHLGRFMGQDVYRLLASHHLSILGLFLDISKINVVNKNHICYNGSCTTGTLFFDNGRIDVSLNFSGKDMQMTLYGVDWVIKYTPLEKNSVCFVKYNKKFKALPDELIDKELVFNYDEKNNLKFALEYFSNVIKGKAISNIITSAYITKILENIQN